jgi:hypothetical protein
MTVTGWQEGNRDSFELHKEGNHADLASLGIAGGGGAVVVVVVVVVDQGPDLVS